MEEGTINHPKPTVRIWGKTNTVKVAHSIWQVTKKKKSFVSFFLFVTDEAPNIFFIFAAIKRYF